MWRNRTARRHRPKAARTPVTFRESLVPLQSVTVWTRGKKRRKNTPTISSEIKKYPRGRAVRQVAATQVFWRGGGFFRSWWWHSSLSLNKLAGLWPFCRSRRSSRVSLANKLLCFHQIKGSFFVLGSVSHITPQGRRIVITL